MTTQSTRALDQRVALRRPKRIVHRIGGRKQAPPNRRDLQASISAYDALALIPTDRAAFSYQPKDLKSVCRAVRRRFLFDVDAVLGRGPIDLLSTFRDTFRFKLVSLGEKRSFLWRHCGIKSMEHRHVK